MTFQIARGALTDGEIWVLDEARHCVASFRVKLSHRIRGGPDSVDVALNMKLAEQLIQQLNEAQGNA